MENTAIQEAIEKLQIEMQKATEQESPNIASGFHHSITILKKFLPKEREQMKQARENGFTNGVAYSKYNKEPETFDEYYKSEYEA